MNSEPQGDMAASFWLTRIGRNSDRHAVSIKNGHATTNYFTGFDCDIYSAGEFRDATS